MNRLFFTCNIILAVIITSNNQPPAPSKVHNNRLLAANSNREIQVNRLPHPFNVGGLMPYQVWIDGERLPLNSQETKQIVETLNLKFEQPDNTAAIHAGEGWLQPLNINNGR